MFDEYVDDVTVIQYNERGEILDEIDKENKDQIQNYLKNSLDKNTPFMVTVDDKLYISEGRVPCPQLFQRLMVTYDGKVNIAVMIGELNIALVT